MKTNVHSLSAFALALVAFTGCAVTSSEDQSTNEQPDTGADSPSVSNSNSGNFTFGEPTWVIANLPACDDQGACDVINFNVSSQIHGSRSGHPASLPAYPQTENLDTIGDLGNVWAVSGFGSTHNPYGMHGWFELRDASNRTLNTWPNPSHDTAGLNDHECWYANQWGNYPYMCFDHANTRQWWPTPTYPVTIIHHMTVDYDDQYGEENVARECTYIMQVSGAIAGPYCNTCGATTCH